MSLPDLDYVTRWRCTRTVLASTRRAFIVASATVIKETWRFRFNFRLDLDTRS